MPLVTLFGLVGNTLSILVLQSPNIDMKVRVMVRMMMRKVMVVDTNIFLDMKVERSDEYDVDSDDDDDCDDGGGG